MGDVMACRACGRSLFQESLLRYEGMPGVAQHFPDAASLAMDKGVDLDVRQCSACGLVQLTNEPVSYFRDVIRAAGFSDEMRAFRDTQLQAFVAAHGLRGRKVLEVGCGRGEYLAILQSCGVEAFGLENAVDAVAHNRAHGLQVSQGFLDTPGQRLADAPFDAFAMFSFLEHLPDPVGTLLAINDNLTEGAVGLVEVPDFDRILEKRMFAEFTSDHLFYFTRDTLARTLGLAGFEVTACASVWHGYILSAVVRKRPKLDVTAFHGARMRLAEQLDTFVSAFSPGRVAVWGAGHQALAVLAMASLGDRIRYVVDSAPFKQGRFTPATHIPIVAPRVLDEDPVDAVIVMAASYSDEVLRMLLARQGDSMSIAILREEGLETIPEARRTGQ